MVWFRWIVVSLTATLAICLSACGGGDDGGSGSSESRLTTDELEGIVLLLEDLGPEYQHLRIDTNFSGAFRTDDLLEFALDEQTRGVLQRLIEDGSRVNGYIQAYTHNQVESSGPVYFFSQVDLFNSPDGASAFFEDLEANPTRAQTNDDGDEFSDVTRFEVTGVGDEAYGETGSISYYIGIGANTTRVTVHLTRVVFRRGPLVSTVSVDRADQNDVESDVVELARMMDEKQRATLSE